jgi:PRC-barrel domain
VIPEEPHRANGRGRTLLSKTRVDLGKPGARFLTPGECVGYEVLDPMGEKIGTADELFVNANDEPEYVRIRLGFLGLKFVLLPVETVAVDKQRRTLVLH